MSSQSFRSLPASCAVSAAVGAAKVTSIRARVPVRPTCPATSCAVMSLMQLPRCTFACGRRRLCFHFLSSRAASSAPTCCGHICVLPRLHQPAVGSVRLAGRSDCLCRCRAADIVCLRQLHCKTVDDAHTHPCARQMRVCTANDGMVFLMRTPIRVRDCCSSEGVACLSCLQLHAGTSQCRNRLHAPLLSLPS